MESKRDSLAVSIIATMAAFYLGQCLLFLGLSLLDGFPPIRGFLFYPVSFAVHASAAAFLVGGREEFRIESDGRRLSRVNLANRLTLVRISTLPTILFLILSGREKRILLEGLVLTAIVFLTDLLDGIVSRTLRQCTRIGRMLDSISDYCLLGALSIVLLAYGLIAPWFFWLIAGRLLFQGVGMTIFFFLGRAVPPKPTFLGKAVVASTMSLYALSILEPLLPEAYGRVFLGLEIAVAVLVVVSMADKLVVFLKHAASGDKGPSSGREGL